MGVFDAVGVERHEDLAVGELEVGPEIGLSLIWGAGASVSSSDSSIVFAVALDGHGPKADGSNGRIALNEHQSLSGTFGDDHVLSDMLGNRVGLWRDPERAVRAGRRDKFVLAVFRRQSSKPMNQVVLRPIKREPKDFFDRRPVRIAADLSAISVKTPAIVAKSRTSPNSPP